MKPKLIARRQDESLMSEDRLARLGRPVDGGGFGKRGQLSRPAPVDDGYQPPRDRELGRRVTAAIGELQDAIDAAILAGLIVEPSFKPISGRFNDFGVSVDSYVCNVQIFRKLT